jgi:hypothetical protein
MYYSHRRNLAYAVWFVILLIVAYFGIRAAIRAGHLERVAEIAALTTAYSGVSLVANASKIFD